MSAWVTGAIAVGSTALNAYSGIKGSKAQAKAQENAQRANEAQDRENRLQALLSAYGANSEQEALDRRGGLGRSVDLLTQFRDRYSPNTLLNLTNEAYAPFEEGMDAQIQALLSRAKDGNIDERMAYLIPLLQANTSASRVKGRRADLLGKQIVSDTLAENTRKGANVVSGATLGSAARARAYADTAGDQDVADAAVNNAGLVRALKERALEDSYNTDLLGAASRYRDFKLGPITDALAKYSQMTDYAYSPLKFTDRPTPLNVNYTPIDRSSTSGVIAGGLGQLAGKAGGMYMQQKNFNTYMDALNKGNEG